jgi:hypothetical protein
MNMTAKSSQNYTEEMIVRMSTEYDLNPTRATVDALAACT